MGAEKAAPIATMHRVYTTNRPGRDMTDDDHIWGVLLFEDLGRLLILEMG